MQENAVRDEAVTELQLIRAKQEADFALTPVGQTVKQFEVMQRMARMYTESTIVPETYKGNIGNCVIALDMAVRMKANPLMIMQNLYIVRGNPSWSSKFLIATINMSGRYTALRYRKRSLGEITVDGHKVENIECTAYATELATGEVLESDPVSILMAVREGWYTKPGSKWVTMPELMLTYRAAAFWQRAYCPEISMGFLTSEEAEDVWGAETKTERVNDRLNNVAMEAVKSAMAEEVTEEKSADTEPMAATEPKKVKKEKMETETSELTFSNSLL